MRSRVETVEQLNPDSIYLDLFDTSAYDLTDTSDYIYLRLFPDADSDDEVYGDRPGLRNTFSRSAVFAPSTVRRGLRCTVKDRRRLVLDILRMLITISETSAFNVYKPIKVIDFCTPEPGEEKTIRFGAIQIDRKPGLSGRGTTQNKVYVDSDWEFIFRETRLRNK